MTLDYALSHATELYAQTAERLFSALAAGARLGTPETAPPRHEVPPR